MRDKLPYIFIIERNLLSKHWRKFIEWANETLKQNISPADEDRYYWVVAGELKVSKEIDAIEAQLLLTLDQWHAIVYPEYEVVMVVDNPKNNNMKDLNTLCKEAHENSKSKGFYDEPKNIGEMLALIHSEVSEALEADRKGKYVEPYIDHAISANNKDEAFIEWYKQHIKGTFEEEMADIVIRVFDMCGFKGIDLAAHVDMKMRFLFL